MTHRISFVSDLHLFARRSEAQRYAEGIRTAARRTAVLVWGAIFSILAGQPCRHSRTRSRRPFIGCSAWPPSIPIPTSTTSWVITITASRFWRSGSARTAHTQLRLAPLLSAVGAEYLLARRRSGKEGHDAQAAAGVSFALVKSSAGRRLQPRGHAVVHRARLHQPLPYLLHRKRRVAERES